MSRTVLVTGASGFIARHVVLQAMQNGLHVRASVRNARAADAVRAALAPHLAASDPALDFVELDLGRDDGWSRAMEGVDAVIHTASPFPARQPRDPAELIVPAVDGARRAITFAAAAGVRRVVMTSSIAAVINGPPPGKAVYDEADWSDPASRFCTIYDRSKTLAERAAWDLVAGEAPAVRLTAINPGFVLGPALGEPSGTSLNTIARMLKGKDPMVPNVGFPVVDVRDVARLHVAALSTPASEGRRFLASGGYMSFPEMARALKAAYPRRRIATAVAPDWLLRAVSLFDPSIGTILPALGRRADVSARQAAAVFGISFIPAREALLAAAASLVEAGSV